MRHIEEIVSRQVNRWNSITQTLHYAPGASAEAAARPTMANDHPVFCFSRDLGSGARIIAHLLCERIGYHLFGSQMIDEIAKDMHVQRQLVDSLDEHTRGELHIVIESWMHGREIERQEYLAALVRVVQTLALQGGVIVLGRGAAFILKDHSALNVLITAPLELRINRLMEYENLDEQTARRRVQESDHEREQFVRRVFHANVHDGAHYDLVINTARLTPDDGVHLILEALARRGWPLERISLATAER